MLAPTTTARLMRSLRAEPTDSPAVPTEIASLSPREREILSLIGDNLTNRKIGQKRYLSEKTVKYRTSRLLTKLGVRLRVQAAVLASRLEQSRTEDHRKSTDRPHQPSRLCRLCSASASGRLWASPQGPPCPCRSGGRTPQERRNTGE